MMHLRVFCWSEIGKKLVNVKCYWKSANGLVFSCYDVFENLMYFCYVFAQYAAVVTIISEKIRDDDWRDW